MQCQYLTVILRGRAGYELIYIINEAVEMVLASLTTFHTPTIDGIRVWQEYNTCEARFIKCNEFILPRKISTSQIMKVTEDNTSPLSLIHI